MRREGCVNWMRGNLSEFIRISNHHDVHPPQTSDSFVTDISIKPKKKTERVGLPWRPQPLWRPAPGRDPFVPGGHRCPDHVLLVPGVELHAGGITCPAGTHGPLLTLCVTFPNST